MKEAVILCAGKGERLLPLTQNIPKPLIPIGDKPLLHFNLCLLKKYGINQVYINTSYLHEKIISSFPDGYLGMKIRYSFEQELLGTSGALNNFKNFLDGSFFVIYGDNLSDLNLKEMYDFHKNKEGLASLFLHKEKNPDVSTTPGVVLLKNNSQIEKILENPSISDKDLIRGYPKNQLFNNAGIYLLEKRIFEYIPPGFSDFAREVFPNCLQNGELLSGFTSNCFFRELGSIKRYFATLEELNRRLIKLNFEY